MCNVLIAALACFASISCTNSCTSSDPPETGALALIAGRISGGWSAELRVVYGKRWAIGHDALVSETGEFQVPSWAGAVAAYVDSIRNGRFDRFAEPSTVCRHERVGWRCEITHQRATLHRKLSTRDDTRRDSTYVFWEDYRPDGTRIEQSKLCVGDRCTSLQPSPFLSETAIQVHQLLLCGEEGFARQDAIVRTASNISTVPIAQPATLEAHAHLKRRSDDLVLQIDVASIDRILIWAGVSNKLGDVQEVDWHSEENVIAVTERDGGFEARVPLHAMERCTRDPRCVLVVQLLKYWREQDGLIINATEYRQAVSFRQYL
jgi:hypothetical protein